MKIEDLSNFFDFKCPQRFNRTRTWREATLDFPSSFSITTLPHTPLWKRIKNAPASTIPTVVDIDDELNNLNRTSYYYSL